MKLIGEINSQRTNNRTLRGTVQAEIGRIRQIAQAREIAAGKKGISADVLPDTMKVVEEYREPGTGPDTARSEIDPSNILERNRRRIAALKESLDELDARRGALPPIERIAFYTQAQNKDELSSPRPAEEEDEAFVGDGEKLPMIGNGE